MTPSLAHPERLLHALAIITLGRSAQWTNLGSPGQHQTQTAFHVSSGPIRHELHFGHTRLIADLRRETSDAEACRRDG